MESRGVTAVEFILLAGIAVFLVTVVSLFAVSNIFNPAVNQSNQTSGGVVEVRKCILVDCSDACNASDPTRTQLLQSGVCVGGKCIYRGGRVCDFGCESGRCKGSAPKVDFTNNSFQGTKKGDYYSASSDLDGTITAYHWEFGDGATNTTSHSSVSHQYFAAGLYNVTLKVIDNDGMENSTTREIRVT
ncbi:MAG: PKD domain-containing protein [Candidatus Micrarchaeota archaeon]